MQSSLVFGVAFWLLVIYAKAPCPGPVYHPWHWRLRDWCVQIFRWTCAVMLLGYAYQALTWHNVIAANIAAK